MKTMKAETLRDNARAEVGGIDIKSKHKNESGGGGSYLLLWLIGVPFPILAIIFLLRGCS